MLNMTYSSAGRSLLLLIASSFVVSLCGTSYGQAPVTPPATHRSAERLKQFLGCWSSTDANFLRITDATLQTRNSQRPLKYTIGTAPASTEVLLITLEQTDESNELGKFLVLRMRKSDEMEVFTYDSVEDISAGKMRSKTGIWVHDTCKNVQTFLANPITLIISVGAEFPNDDYRESLRYTIELRDDKITVEELLSLVRERYPDPVVRARYGPYFFLYDPVKKEALASNRLVSDYELTSGATLRLRTTIR